jgi:hypothetical protein
MDNDIRVLPISHRVEVLRKMLKPFVEIYMFEDMDTISTKISELIKLLDFHDWSISTGTLRNEERIDIAVQETEEASFKYIPLTIVRGPVVVCEGSAA